MRASSFVVLVVVLARRLREHRVDDLHDELLRGARQLVDALASIEYRVSASIGVRFTS